MSTLIVIIAPDGRVSVNVPEGTFAAGKQQITAFLERLQTEGIQFENDETPAQISERIEQHKRAPGEHAHVHHKGDLTDHPGDY